MTEKVKPPSLLIEKARIFARDHVVPQAEVWELDRAMAEMTLRKAVAAGFTHHFSKPLNFDHLNQYLNSLA